MQTLQKTKFFVLTKFSIFFSVAVIDSKVAEPDPTSAHVCCCFLINRNPRIKHENFFDDDDKPIDSTTGILSTHSHIYISLIITLTYIFLSISLLLLSTQEKSFCTSHYLSFIFIGFLSDKKPQLFQVDTREKSR